LGALSEYIGSVVKKRGFGLCSVNKIESNPEWSKHPDTAIPIIFGLDIDFVDLRNTSYDGDSWI